MGSEILSWRWKGVCVCGEKNSLNVRTSEGKRNSLKMREKCNCKCYAYAACNKVHARSLAHSLAANERMS